MHNHYLASVPFVLHTMTLCIHEVSKQVIQENQTARSTRGAASLVWTQSLRATLHEHSIPLDYQIWSIYNSFSMVFSRYSTLYVHFIHKCVPKIDTMLLLPYAEVLICMFFSVKTLLSTECNHCRVVRKPQWLLEWLPEQYL